MEESDLKRIKISVILIVLSFAVFIINGFMSGFTAKDKLSKQVETLGNLYYQSIFYPSMYFQNGNTDFIESLENDGYKVTLRTMFSNLDDVDKDSFKYKNTACDIDKTYVIIYPKKPFGQKDIKVKTTLSCG